LKEMDKLLLTKWLKAITGLCNKPSALRMRAWITDIPER
jgi:hypothetical protein